MKQSKRDREMGMNKSNNTINICNDIFIKSPNISISHGFFGRHGGNSDGLFASLNCSRYVGDTTEAVSANFDVVRKSLRNHANNDATGSKNYLPIFTLKQVHSNLCLEISESENGELNISEDKYALQEADALVTKVPGIAIGIYTADCAPVLFYDPVQSVIGAAHAGWEGALLGVLASTVNKMRELGCDPKNIRAAIGPCAGVESYEVDETFMLRFSGSGDCFQIVNHRLHFDLSKFCVKKLLSSGLQNSNVEVLGIDTCANPDKYFSYRVARKNSAGVCGRQISVIGIL